MSLPPETQPPSSQPPRQPRKHFLFTHPRTASNLLMRVLNLDDQPSLLPSAKRDYYFLPVAATKSGKLKSRPLNLWTTGERNQVANAFQGCFDTLEAHVREAEAQGKDVFVREHALWLMEPVSELTWAQGKDSTADEPPWTIDASAGKYGDARSSGNETVFPDGYLRVWRPTFLIRHPALVFPSLYRTTVDNAGSKATKGDPAHVLEMTLKWLRVLFDWYIDQCEEQESDRDGVGPIVLDADDVINDPGIMRRYCEIVGLDSTKLKYEWNVASAEEVAKMHFVQRRMLSTLSASTGIMKTKTAIGMDFSTEAQKWRAEFGEENGLKMERWVRAAMPDYEYLRERRLR